MCWGGAYWPPLLSSIGEGSRVLSKQSPTHPQCYFPPGADRFQEGRGMLRGPFMASFSIRQYFSFLCKRKKDCSWPGCSFLACGAFSRLALIQSSSYCSRPPFSCSVYTQIQQFLNSQEIQESPLWHTNSSCCSRPSCSR